MVAALLEQAEAWDREEEVCRGIAPALDQQETVYVLPAEKK
jgi:hypothetical protein